MRRIRLFRAFCGCRLQDNCKCYTLWNMNIPFVKPCAINRSSWYSSSMLSWFGWALFIVIVAGATCFVVIEAADMLCTVIRFFCFSLFFENVSLAKIFATGLIDQLTNRCFDSLQNETLDSITVCSANGWLWGKGPWRGRILVRTTQLVDGLAASQILGHK